MSIEAMKLALEALENSRDYVYLSPTGDCTWSEQDQLSELAEAITALRQAIEQAQKHDHQAQASNGLRDAMNRSMDIAKQAQKQSDIPKIGCVNHDCDKCQQAQKQDWNPHEEMQEEIARLSEIIGTNSFYQAGHSNALEWAAQMAELEDPCTSDWVYDDPHELAKALRKGPEMPPMAQEQKPVARYFEQWQGQPIEEIDEARFNSIPEAVRFKLYESTPQRQWVGLTPQERDEINEQVYGAVPHHVAFHHAIEAKLRSKNA